MPFNKICSVPGYGVQSDNNTESSALLKEKYSKNITILSSLREAHYEFENMPVPSPSEDFLPMEQDVNNSCNAMCSTCLSTDRDLFSVNEMHGVNQIFKMLMQDFLCPKYANITFEMENLFCWECLAHMKKIFRFKNQVHTAQESFRDLVMNRTHKIDEHAYISQSLSSLTAITKVDYDKIYLYYTETEWPQSFIVDTGDVKNEQFDIAQTVKDNIHLDIDEHILQVPEMVLENPVTGVMSRIVVGTDALVSTADNYKDEISLANMDTSKIEIFCHQTAMVEPKKAIKPESSKLFNYVTDYMTEAEMLEVREKSKLKIQYASSVYKCELCIIGFNSQQQVEDHFVSEHSAKPGRTACKVCYIYVEDGKLSAHTDEHYLRYTCKLCAREEYSERLITLHVKTHMDAQVSNAVIKIGSSKVKKKVTSKEVRPTIPKGGELRKLLSKTTIEGYKCLECDMFFKNSRARKNHVARFHREGFQCDHCKKRFVNKTTLTTHLKLHEGPLPREECPICHKMVRVMQLKYHIRRHESKKRYECIDCNKTFSHLATYQAHLKYSRAHASDDVLKFPCPMCNKGYPTKQAMQDHFNYQHLGKTSHKCPICEKPIASRANVEKHMMRMHGQKKERPRNHVCVMCTKAFTDKKALNQHEVIHSGERPLSCDICQQTFKQKASLYTHRKRVHKVFPAKKLVQYMEPKLRSVVNVNNATA